ncbi:MAG TPA: nucleotide pyrophosphohydrolase, partial [Pirellulales bacterium]|nr:nucleotide pyrophosphohydrolase [Pirellulales bacterium]
MNDAHRPSTTSDAPGAVTLADFQRLIRDMYFEKDVARGIDGTFMWLMEEIGELAGALRGGTHDERLCEFADVLAWLA